MNKLRIKMIFSRESITANFELLAADTSSFIKIETMKIEMESDYRTDFSKIQHIFIGLICYITNTSWSSQWIELLSSYLIG